MDALILFFLLMGCGLLILALLNIGENKEKKRTPSARKRTPSASKSPSSAGSEPDYYFGPPQLKLTEDADSKTGWVVKCVMFRGRIPAPRDMSVSFALSAVDVTDGEDAYKPVFSLVDAAQEAETPCYFMSGDFGPISDGAACMGIPVWIKIGMLIPELIQPPRSGKRDIRIFVRMFNTDKPGTIFGGLVVDSQGEFIYRDGLTFTYEFTDKGYEDVWEEREESQILSLKIGIAVAMSDGSFADTEGEKLKAWIIKEISAFPDSEKERLKNLFNTTLKQGYEEAKTGSLSLSSLVARLAEIGDKKSKYAAFQLCCDVMVADGSADPGEMAVIRRVSEGLDLDVSEAERMIDAATTEIDQGQEYLIDVDESWPNEQKCKYLTRKFHMWSNRLSALPEEDRQSAQKMLDTIAELRKKYGC